MNFRKTRVANTALVGLLLAAIGPAGALAQGIPNPPVKLPAASPVTSEPPGKELRPGPGTLIVLPTKLVAGQRATLGVLDATGHLTPGAVVEFSGGERVTTDATGRALFAAPPEDGILLARLPDQNVTASTTVIRFPTDPQPNPGDGVQVLDYPRIISVSDRFVVDGYGFRGDADGNRVTLADRPALVLAASPIALVLFPGPHAVEGPAQLLIEVGGRSPGPVPVTLVSTELTSPKKQLAPKEKGKLSVHVRGTDQRVPLEVRNLTPQVVDLPRGNTQRVISSGGAVNTAEIEMQGLRAGDFSVSVRIVPAATGLPDMEAARQHLLAARALANREWRERVDRVLHSIEHDPQNVSHIQDELEKMLGKKPEGEMGRLIEAAWKELLRH